MVREESVARPIFGWLELAIAPSVCKKRRFHAVFLTLVTWAKRSLAVFLIVQPVQLSVNQFELALDEHKPILDVSGTTSDPVRRNIAIL